MQVLPSNKLKYTTGGEVMIQMSIEISLLQRAKTTTIATVFISNIHLSSHQTFTHADLLSVLDQCATEIAQGNDVEYTRTQYLTWTLILDLYVESYLYTGSIRTRF
jgi:hypothetical protein